MLPLFSYENKIVRVIDFDSCMYISLQCRKSDKESKDRNKCISFENKNTLKNIWSNTRVRRLEKKAQHGDKGAVWGTGYRSD